MMAQIRPLPDLYWFNIWRCLSYTKLHKHDVQQMHLPKSERWRQRLGIGMRWLDGLGHKNEEDG